MSFDGGVGSGGSHDHHVAFRDTKGRLSALRMAGPSSPLRQPSRVRRGIALGVLALLVALGVNAFWSRVDATDLDVLSPLPEGMAVVEEGRRCRADGRRDRICSAVGYVAAGVSDEKDARDRLVASLAARGWRDTGNGLMYRDGAYLLVRPISDALPVMEDVREDRSRALAHDPPAKVEVVVLAWPPA